MLVDDVRDDMVRWSTTLVDGDTLGAGGGSKSQSEMCLGKVQGVISYPDGQGAGCIIPHKGKDIQGLCPECIDIWD